jgi:uncharacterized protein (TIGR03437 family)
MSKPLNIVLVAVISVGSLAGATTSNRIPEAVDAARTTVLQGKVHPLARPEFDRGPVDPGQAIDYASIYFKTAPGIEEFLADLQNPSSANFHKWLTPEQFGDRFGLTAADTGKVAAWLKSRGLRVHDIARGRRWITFSGTAGQISAALKTEFRRFEWDGQMHFAYASDPSVPAAIAPVVAGFGGLDDFELSGMGRIVPDDPATSGPQPRNTSGVNHYLTPDDLATIYNFAPLLQAGIDGTGQTIAVIGRSDFNPADVRSFRARYKLPPNEPQVKLFGPDPGTTGSALEANIDLDVVGAVARNATILYVNSRSTSTSAQYAVDQNLAPVMTYSFGGCEAYFVDTYRPIAQQANAQGITWLASSGDSGAATCDVGSPTPQATRGATASYPATIPEITAVGGTEFNDAAGAWWSASNSATLASALGYIPEKVWGQQPSRLAVIGGGGGASVLFQKPLWQTGPGVPADGVRDIPDVAFSSSPHDAYEIIYTGGVAHIYGTSAASPLFAGIVALLNQSLAAQNPKAPVGLGNINPALYRMAQATPQVFHDIVTGDNKVPCAQGSPACVDGMVGYAAAPGYDLGSGLGSLDASQFVSNWSAGTASTTTLSASSATFGLTDSITFTAKVTGADGKAPTGTVAFVANDLNLGSATLVTGTGASTASLTVDGATLAGAGAAVSAVYGGDANYAGSAGSTPVALQIPATGSMVVLSVSPSPVRPVEGYWDYTFTATEKAGVATTITAFTVDGGNNLSGLSSTKIAANGSVTFAGGPSGLTVPANRVFHLEGRDADGTLWKRDLTVPFLPAVRSVPAPGISVSVAPATVQRNPQADPACQWQQFVTVQETGGALVNLSSFTASTTSLTSQIPQLFGTMRLAPWGMLTATVCLSNVNAPVQRVFSVGGVANDAFVNVSGSATATLTAQPASTVSMTTSVPSVTIPVAGTDATGSASVDLKFASGSPNWNAKILSPGLPKWLKVSANSGSGPATLTLQADASGLSNGAYNAVLSIEATDTLPQVIQIPVALVVGASGDISIAGVGNAASGALTFAPGQLVAVYGTGLASTLGFATYQPLPFKINGTSATVNGISAPLWFVSPNQINLQLPYETSAGTAVLAINNGGKVAAFNLPISAAAPGIFTDLSKNMVPVSSGTPGQTIFGFITGDGDLTPTLASGATSLTTSSPNFPKSRLPLSMTIGGEPASVVFSGVVPGLIGVTQINFTIPADLPPGVAPVVVTVGGAASVPANITVTAK